MESLKYKIFWRDALNILRDYTCQARLLYLANSSIIVDGENKLFHDKTKVKQYLSANTDWHTVLEVRFPPKTIDYKYEKMRKNNTIKIKQRKTQLYNCV